MYLATVLLKNNCAWDLVVGKFIKTWITQCFSKTEFRFINKFQRTIAELRRKWFENEIPITQHISLPCNINYDVVHCCFLIHSKFGLSLYITWFEALTLSYSQYNKTICIISKIHGESFNITCFGNENVISCNSLSKESPLNSRYWTKGKCNFKKKTKLEQTCYIFAMSHPQRLGQKYHWKK